MNYKLTTLLALASGAVYVNAEIALSDVLTIEGFIDSSYAHRDSELRFEDEKFAESDNSFDVDQVEIDFHFDFGPLTAQVDLQSAYFGELEFEQAFFEYELETGGLVAAGRFDSWHGLEAFEPTGLYQYSTAYDPELAAGSPIDMFGEMFHDVGLHGFERISDLFGAPVARQHNGVRYSQAVGSGWLGVSVQDGHLIEDGRLGGDTESSLESDGMPSSYAVELAGGYTLSETLRVQAGGFVENWDGSVTDSINADGRNWGLNGHLVYEEGNLTVAAELFYSNVGVDLTETSLSETADLTVESYGALLMANVALNESDSITGRLSYVDSEIDFHEFEVVHAHLADYYKATIAYNHAITANLLIVTELSYVDGEVFEDNYESVMGAVRALFTF